MPTDVPNKQPISAWRVAFVTCCLTGPACVILAFASFLAAVWLGSGKFGVTGAILVAMALVAWGGAAIASQVDGKDHQIYLLEGRIRNAIEKGYRG